MDDRTREQSLGMAIPDGDVLLYASIRIAILGS